MPVGGRASAASAVFVKSVSSSPHFTEKRLNKLFIFIIFYRCLLVFVDKRRHLHSFTCSFPSSTSLGNLKELDDAGLRFFLADVRNTDCLFHTRQVASPMGRNQNRTRLQSERTPIKRTPPTTTTTSKTSPNALLM